VEIEKSLSAARFTAVAAISRMYNAAAIFVLASGKETFLLNMSD